MSFAMQEPEPLKLKRDYGMQPTTVHHAPARDNVRYKAPDLTPAQRREIARASGTLKQVAAMFSVSHTTVSRCRQEFQRPTEAPVRSSRTSEAVAGGTPCDESPAGPKTGRGQEIGDHLL